MTRIHDHTLAALAPGSAPASVLRDFAYDSLSRLCSASGRRQGPGGIEPYLLRYAYDAADNRIEVEDGLRREELQALQMERDSNRLRATADGAGKHDQVHDRHGNLGAIEGIGALRWDYRQQLAGVVRGGTSERYVYGSSGHRVRKLSDFAGTETLYLGTLDLQRERPAGLSQAAPPADHWRLSIAGSGRLAVLDTRHGVRALHHLLADHLGSVALELDAQGELMHYTEYLPFGEVALRLSPVPDAAATPYGYSGKELDPTTGLLYYGARYLAPALGRWISPDPAGSIDGLNLYRFVQDNPVTLHDPEGLVDPPGRGRRGSDPGHAYVPRPPAGWTGARNKTVLVRVTEPGGFSVHGRKLVLSSHSAEAKSALRPSKPDKVMNHFRSPRTRAQQQQLTAHNAARAEQLMVDPQFAANQGHIGIADKAGTVAKVVGKVGAVVPGLSTAASIAGAAASAANAHFHGNSVRMQSDEMAAHGRTVDGVVHQALTTYRQAEHADDAAGSVASLVPFAGSIRKLWRAVRNQTSNPTDLKVADGRLDMLGTLSYLDLAHPSPHPISRTQRQSPS